MHICPACGSRFTNEVRFCPHDGNELHLAEEPEPVDPLLGTTIDGRYRLDEVLGEGGMGVVYLATHTALNKRMALKVLRQSLAMDATVVQRFVQEAQASSAIGHANIVDILDFGTFGDGAIYFVMEHLDGEPLTQRIRRGPLSLDEAVHITEQIASALGAAHARGIIHRDLKPDNVHLVHRSGTEAFVKVLDFGIAKVGGANSKLTRTGTVFGTPYYMSPEQAAGQSVDARADVYALGVILFEMLTGQVPFDGDTFMGILTKHMFEPPPRPSDVRARDFGGLEGVVLHALAKRPEERYPTMEALVADLYRVRAGERVSVPPSPASRAPQVEAARSAPATPVSRTPLYVIGAILSLLGAGSIVGAIAALATAEEPEPAAPATHVESRPPQADPPLAPEPPPPETIEERPQVRVESDPPGADVLSDGVLIGNTPVSIPLPDDPMTLELRRAGHRPLRVELTEHSGERIRATLEALPTQPAPPSRMAGGRATMQTPRTMRAHQYSSEVLDPWAP